MSRKQLKQLGYTLLATGFMWGAVECVWYTDRVNWMRWGVAMALLVVGVVATRLGQRVGSEQSEQVKQEVSTIELSLRTLVDKISCMNDERDQVGVFEFCQRIDDDCIEPINDFVEAREAIIHQRGLPVYAKLMDNFALGERALNRAWCAAADGYIDELHSCLERAQLSISAALAVLEESRDSDKEAG